MPEVNVSGIRPSINQRNTAKRVQGIVNVSNNRTAKPLPDILFWETVRLLYLE